MIDTYEIRHVEGWIWAGAETALDFCDRLPERYHARIMRDDSVVSVVEISSGVEIMLRKGDALYRLEDHPECIWKERYL